MTIHWSKPLLEKLLSTDIWNRVSETQVDSSFNTDANYSISFYNGKTGENLKDAPVPHAIRVSRGKFRKLLAEGVDVEYGKVLRDVKYDEEGKIRASFEDGSHVEGSLVVGSDGHRSKTRELLFGEKATPQQVGDGYQLGWVAIRYSDAEKAKHVRKLHPINTAAFHPTKKFMIWTAIADAPDPNKPEDWVFQVMPSWQGLKENGETSIDTLKKFKEMASDFTEPWKSAVAWIPDDHEMSTSNLTYWETTTWNNHNGRITLCGDSAHPLPPRMLKLIIRFNTRSKYSSRSRSRAKS
jgi:2-polyprenyl-6-methoxyphenol hydroxylase-like FAD-dependent oxidoreductase